MKSNFIIFIIQPFLALPMNSLRHKRGLGTSPRCARCSGDFEDALLCLRDGPHSLDVWNHLGFSRESNFFLMDAARWVKVMAMGSNGCLFLAALWWVWRWRLMTVIGNEQ